jgi:hypothetical protein
MKEKRKVQQRYKFIQNKQIISQINNNFAPIESSKNKVFKWVLYLFVGWLF